MSQNTERDKHNPGHSLCDNSSSHAGRQPGRQPELLQSTGEGEGTNCLGSSPHKTSSNGQQREKHKQKQQKAPHTSDLSGGTRGAGDKTTKGDNNVCPENTTQLAVCGSKKKGPSVSVPFAAAQQGPEQRRRGRCCTAGAREHGKTPSSVSPRVFASVFLPSVPLLVLPSLKTTSRKKSAGPRALVG